MAEENFHRPDEVRSVVQNNPMTLEREAALVQEHLPFDLDTGEEFLIEKPERVRAPYQLLVVLSPKSKRDHIIAKVEIYETGGEKVTDERGRRIPIAGSLKMYWCPSCCEPLRSEWDAGKTVICSKCLGSFSPTELVGEIYLSHTPKAAAAIISRIHFRLQFADLFFMRFVHIIKHQERHATEKSALDVERNLQDRVSVAYPFHKLAKAIHMYNAAEMGQDHQTRAADFQNALEHEIRRYL